MTLRLTPAMLEAAYEYLRSTPPFRGWRLPHADDVEFRITDAIDYMGLWEKNGVQHRISVSDRRVGHTKTLMVVMAHEMVHIRQDRDGTDKGPDHNDAFRKHARRICRVHGFDPKEF